MRNRQDKLLTLERFICEIETRPLVVDEFDEKLWVVIVEKVTAQGNGRLEFAFKDRSCVCIKDKHAVWPNKLILIKYGLQIAQDYYIVHEC